MYAEIAIVSAVTSSCACGCLCACARYGCATCAIGESVVKKGHTDRPVLLRMGLAHKRHRPRAKVLTNIAIVQPMEIYSLRHCIRVVANDPALGNACREASSGVVWGRALLPRVQPNGKRAELTYIEVNG